MRLLKPHGKTVSKLGITLSLALMTALIVAGCGGGGDGSSQLSMVEYTGLTTPAVLTIDNAEEIALDAYEGGAASGGLGGVSIGAVSSPEKVLPAIVRLNDTLGEVVDPANMGNSIFAGLTDSVAMTGCSGSARLTATINENTGAFSMSMTFYDYDEYCSGESMSGTIAASGTMSMDDPNDPNTWQVVGAVNMSFYTLTFEDATDSISFGGSWTVTAVAQNSEEINFWYVVRDNNSGVSFKFGDPADLCHLVVTDNGATEDIVMDGVFYNPDHGWVNFGIALTLDYFTGLPTSGTIQVWDENQSTVLITVPSADPGYDYTVQINIVGGGSSVTNGNWPVN